MQPEKTSAHAVTEPSKLPFLVSIEEAARLCGGESRSGIYRAIKSGQLLAVKRGRRTLVTLDSINRRLKALPKASFKHSNDDRVAFDQTEAYAND